MSNRVLITCPPMIQSIDRYRQLLQERELNVTWPEMLQVLSEEKLIGIIPSFDGWIIGDDPATERVFAAGTRGRLRAAVKWGVGVDNVDFAGARAHGLDVKNTPGMFGDEVADIAHGYVIALARQTFAIDRGVRENRWPKPVGMSLRGKVAGIVGFGSIGSEVANRLIASKMSVHVYEPEIDHPRPGTDITVRRWPEGLDEVDFLILCCSLTSETHHLLDASTLSRCKYAVRIVNVSRGLLVDENALCDALESGKVHSAALEVFENEPLPNDSRLRGFNQCLFGSHNASNTREAVDRTSHRAIELLVHALDGASSRAS